HAVLREYGHCGSGRAGHDQSQVVSPLIVLDAAKPGIHRRESEPKWQLQLESPKFSFSCNRWSVANASPPMCFFPSSWSSSSSSTEPSPQTTCSDFPTL